MAATAMLATTTWAGGLMTNTNYHIAFDRMFARGASTEIDATFSNPAGRVWGHEGRLRHPSYLHCLLRTRRTAGLSAV